MCLLGICISSLEQCLPRSSAHLGGSSGKEPTCQCRRLKRCRFESWVGKIPWKRAWPPTPIFLPGESYGKRSLVGYHHRVTKNRTLLKGISMPIFWLGCLFSDIFWTVWTMCTFWRLIICQSYHLLIFSLSL